MAIVSSFQPNQILCMEHKNARLFAEAIQVTEVRRLCWARPLVLVTLSNSQNWQDHWNEADFYDLRQGVDLLCPVMLFRAAWDTEVLPLLEKLNHLKRSEGDRLAHSKLREFINQVWQAHPEAFQP